MKSPIEKMLDQVDFKPVKEKPIKSDLPHVTHTGILKIGEIEIEVCVLSNGKRIISEKEMEKVLKFMQ